MSTSRDDSPNAKMCTACSTDSAEPIVAGEDGYCPSCGRRVEAGGVHMETDRDHMEQNLGQVAGVSDRGLRHSRNEDAMHFAVAETDDGPVAVAIVSDGVSSAPRPDEASWLAVNTAITPLAEGAQRGDDPVEVSKTAARAAGQALNKLAGPGGAPAATYLSAIVTTRQVTVCWLGDSRAYWLAANPVVPAGPNDTIDISGGSRRVTRDDSLAEEIVAAGLASMDEAMASPQAHVITRWLGADLPDPEAHVENFTPTGPGVLLLCSDGLWNYRPEAAELAAMAMPAALSRPLDAAADLAKFALDSGGLDNITVVIIPFPPRSDTSLSDDTVPVPSVGA
jgi:serine/threonine protein phosphatase PrpC